MDFSDKQDVHNELTAITFAWGSDGVIGIEC